MVLSLRGIVARIRRSRTFFSSKPKHRRQMKHGGAERLEDRTLLTGAPMFDTGSPAPAEVQNTAPEFSASSYNFTVADNAAIGALIGALTATDADDDGLLYSVQSNDPDEIAVQMDGSIVVEDDLDANENPSYNFVVSVFDGTEFDTANVTITVSDAGGAPSFGASSYTFNVGEDAVVGDLVGTLTASDPDGDSLFYSIVSGDDFGQFAIDTDGKITVAGDLDENVIDSYTLTVDVSDGVDSATATVTINVGDVAEAPVIVNFMAVQRSDDVWEFSGMVVGDIGSINLVFGGVLDGLTATVDESGSFSLQKVIDPTDAGSLTASVQAFVGTLSSAIHTHELSLPV